jgi:hypothetical protein
MTTIKKSINTTTKTTKSTVKATGNTFTLKDGILTLKMPVEFNKTQTGLKINDLITDPKGYKKAVFTDKAGNILTLFKTGFEYESKVKKEKPIAIDTKKLDVLDADEKDALMAILSKLA